jgi:hypothetical protein
MAREKNLKNANWIIFDKLKGFQTRYDLNMPESREYLAEGSKNCLVNETGALEPRFGTQLKGAASSATTPIKSLGRFIPQSGNDILVRSYGTVLEWYDEGTAKWETLETGFTSGYRFGFEMDEISAATSGSPGTASYSYLYYCNTQEAYSRWAGCVAYISSSTANTITKTGTATWASLGFAATGGLIINGTDYTYTGGADTTTLTGVTGDPTGEAAGSAVTQIPTQYVSNPKGNILHLTDNARMIVTGVPTSPCAIFVSKTNDPTDFTFSSPRVATDGAIINVGKVIKGLAQLGDKIYWLTKQVIGWIRFTQIAEYSAGYDVIEIRPECDGGQNGDNVGCVSQLGVLKFDNKVIYISPNGMVKDLGSLAQHYTYQVDMIGDKIKPTLENAIWDSAAGVVFHNKAYIAAKETSKSSYNDIIFVYDILGKEWEPPYYRNASCFLVANDKLYYGSSTNAEVYELEVDGIYTDNYGASSIYPVTSVAYSWRENFDMPADVKKLNQVYLEGEIKKGTSFTISILINEDGYSGTITGTISSTDTDIIFTAQDNNIFAVKTLSSSLLGTNRTSSGLSYFRLYLDVISPVYFYNLQWKYYSSGDGYYWKIKKIGFLIDKYGHELPSLHNSFSG